MFTGLDVECPTKEKVSSSRNRSIIIPLLVWETASKPGVFYTIKLTEESIGSQSLY